MADFRRTPLYDVQAERGARFVPFTGWELPVQYTGVVKETLGVRNQVGLFDVSHMGEFIVEGSGAFEALQAVVTNDLAKLVDGKALYTVMCVPTGGIVDDLIVYREAETRYFLCVNASRRSEDFEHITRGVASFACTVHDLSEEYGQLAVQGPQALALMAELTAHDVGTMAPFTWVDTTVAGIEGVRVARTGYTGEDGVELYCKAARAEALWRAIEGAGAPRGLVLCGLAARDVLRLEMRYPLYGNDIDLDHNPIEAGLGWVVKFKKGEFQGRDALAAAKKEGPTRKWVGFKMIERGIPRPGHQLRAAGEPVGSVTSGTHSPTLGEPIGAGYVSAAFAAPGSAVEVLIRGKPVKAEVVKTPFYNKPKALA